MHAVALLLLVAGPGPAGCSPLPVEAGLEQPGLSLGADILAIDSSQELPALVLRDEQAAQQEFSAAAQGVQAGVQDQPGAAAVAGAAVELGGGWWDAEGEDEGAVEGDRSGGSSGRGLLAAKRLAPSWRGRFDSKYNLVRVSDIFLVQEEQAGCLHACLVAPSWLRLPLHSHRGRLPRFLRNRLLASSFQLPAYFAARPQSPPALQLGQKTMTPLAPNHEPSRPTSPDCRATLLLTSSWTSATAGPTTPLRCSKSSPTPPSAQSASRF